MKRSPLNKTIRLIHFCMAAFILIVISLMFFSFRVNNFYEDLFRQLSIEKIDEQSRAFVEKWIREIK